MALGPLKKATPQPIAEEEPSVTDVSDLSGGTNDGDISIDGQSFSLAELAGLDLNGVEEVRFVTFAAGNYLWAIKTSSLEKKHNKKQNKMQFVIEMKIECRDCYSLVGDGDKEEWIGKEFEQTFWLGDKKALGRFKAFLVDIEPTTDHSELEPLIADLAAQEFEFMCPMKHTKSENDSDVTFANLDTFKASPKPPTAE